MKVIFTFDDGRDDSYYAYTILKKYQLRGTFFVTTGFIDGTFATDKFGIGRKPITINQLKEMFDNDMEIASHGDKHLTETEDFKISYAKLKKWGFVDNKVGFSIPNSKAQDIKKFYEENKSLIYYIRKGRNERCYLIKNKIKYLFYKLFNAQNAFNSFNSLNVNNIGATLFNSIVIKDYTNPKSLKNFLKIMYKKNVVVVLMFHSIVPSSRNSWEWNSGNFEELCRFIRDNKYENCTLKELMERTTNE